MNCACEESDSGIPVSLCAAHQLIVDKRVAAERERCAQMVEALRSEWFHGGVPGDTAVPAGAFPRSMKQLAVVMRDPTINHVTSQSAI